MLSNADGVAAPLKIGPHTIMQGDCLERLREIPDGSVDLILTDPPYGTTACKWDSVIPFERLWPELRRVRKERAAVVMTASQPFTAVMIASNMKEFKYCWVWEKTEASGFLNAKKAPLKAHEDVVVFCPHDYYPQKTSGHPIKRTRRAGVRSECYGKAHALTEYDSTDRYPRSVQVFATDKRKACATHPTQKPVALMEYLIRTYTNEGDTVLDFTMGSGTTGVACARTGRNFIGIELDPSYYLTSAMRIAAEVGL